MNLSQQKTKRSTTSNRPTHELSHMIKPGISPPTQPDPSPANPAPINHRSHQAIAMLEKRLSWCGFMKVTLLPYDFRNHIRKEYFLKWLSSQLSHHFLIKKINNSKNDPKNDGKSISNFLIIQKVPPLFAQLARDRELWIHRCLAERELQCPKGLNRIFKRPMAFLKVNCFYIYMFILWLQNML